MMHDEDPLAAARACFITGPMLGLAAWALIIGAGYLMRGWL